MNIWKRDTVVLAAVCLLAFLSASCEKFLYVEPTNQVAIASFDDVRAVMGAHLKDFKAVPGGKFRGATVPFIEDPSKLILTYYAGGIDLRRYMETFVGKNNKSGVEGALQWQHPDVHTSAWARYYKNIGFYNMILEELGKYPSGDPAKNDQVSAEARVLRAWTFFRLVELFVPYSEAALGLPLNTSPEAVGTYDASRPAQSENYKFITGELEAVLAYKGAADEEFGLFYNPYIIHAILAQVYLYKGGSAAGEKGDYDKALLHAREALKSGVSYAVFDRHVENAAQGFYPKNGFALYDVVVAGNEAQNYIGYPPHVNVYPSKELLGLYGDNDLRKSVYFDPEHDFAILKLRAKTPYALDEFVLFSGAELKLIQAEALARMGREDEAMTELRAFAASRYKTGTEPPYGSEPVLTSILKERRKEFFLDGAMNWIDAARGGIELTHEAIDKSDGSAYTLKAGDFRYTLPIPKTGELDRNRIPQNPGWGAF